MTARLLVVDHPVVQDRLAHLRDVTTPSPMFRQMVTELSALIAYEAMRDLPTAPVTIDTPMEQSISARRVAERVLLVPILRAGLGMIPAVQQMLPFAEVAHVGLRRNEETLEPDVYLNRLPASLSDRHVVVCDPMLATGGSLARAVAIVKQHGATTITALCLIASEVGVVRFHREHPDVGVACAALDPDLNDQGFIVPGLGDAGDRLFGPPD